MSMNKIFQAEQTHIEYHNKHLISCPFLNKSKKTINDRNALCFALTDKCISKYIQPSQAKRSHTKPIKRGKQLFHLKEKLFPFLFVQ